jgi:hypothetical protein
MGVKFRQEVYMSKTIKTSKELMDNKTAASPPQYSVRSRIVELYHAGFPVELIAEQVRLSVGEVELILEMVTPE